MKQQALDLRGVRVRASFTGLFAGTVFEGELRYVTPRDQVVITLDGDNGHETWLPLEDLEAIEDARHKCAACGGLVNRVFPGREDSALLCADCSRERARLLPPPTVACEDCGADGAFRSPKTDAFRCASCHVKADTLSGLGTERRVLEQLEKSDPVLGAVCRGADQDDPRHDWKQLRTSRWRCRSCHANAYSEPAGFTAAKAEQDA